MADSKPANDEFNLIEMPRGLQFRVSSLQSSACASILGRSSAFKFAIMSFLQHSNVSADFLTEPLDGHLELPVLNQYLTKQMLPDYLIIPVIFEGAILHACCIIVDYTNERIVFFNPKGISPLHEGRIVMNIGVFAQGILALLCFIRDSLSSSFEIVYSKTCTQTFFSFSCSDCVKSFIEKYLLFSHFVELTPLGM